MSISADKTAVGRAKYSVWASADPHEMIDVPISSHLQGPDFLGRIIGLLLLCISLPVIALLVLIVRATSKGPGLYKQVRVGKNGKIFVMYKLRSMVIDAEEDSGPVWTQGDEDPRITPIGRFLRKTHLDELPQLLNVVRGEMALFGPRPERPELVHLLADYVPGYLNRLAVRPGITGLAQINLPPDTDLESVRCKLELDCEYIQTANYWLEFKMFIWTAFRLCGIPATIATKIMGLGRQVQRATPVKSGPVTIKDVLRECERQSYSGGGGAQENILASSESSS